MLRTAVCDLLKIRFPVIQGGMAHISTWELVSAVSNAGGLGIIGSGFYEPEWLEEQIHRTREHTDHPFGINIQMASPYLDAITDLVIKEKPAVVTTGAGNPASIISALKKSGIVVIPVIGSGRSARKMEMAGADAVIAEGTEAGGHVGETTTLVLVPEVTAGLGIPVIAAGGFFNGRGLVAALALGAAGIQLGTRFVCSTECIAHPDYKKKILEAVNPSTVVTRQIFGYPQRSLVNELTERFSELEKAGVPVEELRLFDRGRMQMGLIDGDVREGSLLAGQVAGNVSDIKPVKTIINEIINEAEIVISSLNKHFTED